MLDYHRMTTALAASTPAWLDRRAFPFTSRSLALPEGRLHYVDEGAGPPIVFVHGTPSWSWSGPAARAARSSSNRAARTI